MGEFEGVTVSVEEGMEVATLRYFERECAFAERVHAYSGLALPQVREARYAPATDVALAWGSPTETLCLTRAAGRLCALASELAGCADGCLVTLSGGLKVVRLNGPRVTDLLHRLGGTGSVPALGEARRSRLADVAVLALSLRAGETLLVVDRAYLAHLMAWISETLLDFAAG